MFRAKHLFSLMWATGAILVLSACTPFATITSSSGTAPTPVVAYNSLTVGSATPDRVWKTYRADGGYEIRYPLGAYSVRDMGRPSIDAARILYPGAKEVEPHDLPLNQAETYRPKVGNGSNRALLEEMLSSFAFTGE